MTSWHDKIAFEKIRCIKSALPRVLILKCKIRTENSPHKFSGNWKVSIWNQSSLFGTVFVCGAYLISRKKCVTGWYISRDRHAENRGFKKSPYDQKLFIGGWRACFRHLETCFKKFKNLIFWSKIYDFLEFFS